ncbi:hypothetical protein CPL00367_CDS0064 [Klebsiella phage HelplessSquare]
MALYRHSRLLRDLRSRGYREPFRREPGSRVQNARIARIAKARAW